MSQPASQPAEWPAQPLQGHRSKRLPAAALALLRPAVLQDAFFRQAALFATLFAAHAMPPLILVAKGREHYVRWRHVYLPALLAVDCLSLFKMSCWGLMPEVRSGERAKLAFMVRDGWPLGGGFVAGTDSAASSARHLVLTQPQRSG